MLKELCAIGEEIGADVPFNIVGGAQSCTGIGANMLEIFGIRYYNILIACGEGKNSTAEQYALLDKRFNNFIDHKVGDNFYEMIAHLCSRECTAAFKKMYNVFECLYEENETFRKTKEIMLENEAKVAMLSGSGPTIFGLFPNSLFAEEAQEALAKEGIQSFLCHPINKTYEQILPNEEPWRD